MSGLNLDQKKTEVEEIKGRFAIKPKECMGDMDIRKDINERWNGFKSGQSCKRNNLKVRNSIMNAI